MDRKIEDRRRRGSGSGPAFELPYLLIGTVGLLLFFATLGCASLPGIRTSINFSNQPARALIKSTCKGKTTVVQGIFACEEKVPVRATASVKVPPFEGRVIFSEGISKKTSDFNWYPETGFFIWKTKQINDTWLDMDLKEMATTFGDWPVALDIEGRADSVGVITTRGIIYQRVCDDKGFPCSTLSYVIECGLVEKKVGPGEIGACERVSGLEQRIQVKLPAEAKAGSKLYTAAVRVGFRNTATVTKEDVERGYLILEIPTVADGPTLVLMELNYYDGPKLVASRGRAIIHGFDPAWTGLDDPHVMQTQNGLAIVRPVSSDLLEVVRFRKNAVAERKFSLTDKRIDVDFPAKGEAVCSFAWGRTPSDVTYRCYDSSLREVDLP